jgi:hypothetical protein
MDPSSYNQPQAGANSGIPQAQQQAYAAPQGNPMMPNTGVAFNAQQQPQAQLAPPVPPTAQPQYQQFQAPPVPQPGQAAQPTAQVAGAPGAPATGVPGVKPVQSNPNSTQNTLQIAEIRDGIVIMNDGSFRSVVMVKSINFDLMSQREQESVEYSYQGFLNSLYFPIQIFIRSEKVDLQPYIERLDKIRSEHDNMLLALLMNDYIGYIDQLAQQTNIMDKKFYIVVPYFPQVDVQKALTSSKTFVTGLSSLFSKTEQHITINEDDLEKAKTELRNRVQAVMSGLLQSNIQGLPLDTQELIELFYDTYNPDTATRQQLKNFDSLTADIITKGSGAAVQPHMKTELN